ncbi:MAG: hypothetical protein IRY84_06195 [Thermobispora bispora]|nr:hypothetical protein [Thermobispora bispora]
MGNSGNESPLAAEIQGIVEARRHRLPSVRAQIAAWRDIDETLTELDAALGALREHPSITPESAADLTINELPEVRRRIARAIELLTAVEARFARDTVNIGVSGSARMGKSTLLQSISGLGDEQIPTGRDLPVTAVRSRIYNSRSLNQAILRFHSRESFLAEVVHPYHVELKFAAMPTTIDEFRAWSYPTELPEATPGQISMLVRLRDIHEALPTYEADLGRGEQVVSLDGLRRYVAYPSHEERSAGPVECRYLAVRDVRIDCPFPHTEVERLGFVDLPGLGEIAADAEKRHITGLRHDVDAVLLVKRAVDAQAFWMEADGRALDLLDEARGSIRNRGDFVHLVINRPPGQESLAEALRADILHKVNDGQEARYFEVLETDVKNPQAVRDDLLTPLLRKLAARLPVMDADCLAGTREAVDHARASAEAALAEVTRAVRGVRAESGDVIELINREAEQLRKAISKDLSELVDRLRNRAFEAEDPAYVKAVQEVHRETVDWITSGFGVGEQAWCQSAELDFLTDGALVFAEHQMNRIRVEVANRFAALDAYFSDEVEQARLEVGTIIARHCGTLLSGIEGGSALLTELAALLDNPRNPCPALHGAVVNLLTLRMGYRSHLHPRLRRQLDGLQMRYRNPQTGRMETAFTPDDGAEGVHELYVFLVQQALNAAHEIRKALLEEEMTPALVVYAAVEHFLDSFIRSGASEELHSPGAKWEFERFARAYRDQLWPGAHEGIAEGNVRYDHVLTIIEALEKKLAEAGRSA